MVKWICQRRNPVNEIEDDIFAVGADAICCTTNMVVKTNGELVMGAGVAKAFARKYPDLPKIWGERTRQIKKGKLRSNLILTLKDVWLVSFPTKYDWRERSDLDLIKRSALQLYVVAEAMGWNRVILPRPGCANGGLDWEVVKPVLQEILDERFWIICKT